MHTRKIPSHTHDHHLPHQNTPTHPPIPLKPCDDISARHGTAQYLIRSSDHQHHHPITHLPSPPNLHPYHPTFSSQPCDARPQLAIHSPSSSRSSVWAIWACSVRHSLPHFPYSHFPCSLPVVFITPIIAKRRAREQVIRHIFFLFFSFLFPPLLELPLGGELNTLRQARTHAGMPSHVDTTPYVLCSYISPHTLQSISLQQHTLHYIIHVERHVFYQDRERGAGEAVLSCLTGTDRHGNGAYLLVSGV